MRIRDLQISEICEQDAHSLYRNTNVVLRIPEGKELTVRNQKSLLRRANAIGHVVSFSGPYDRSEGKYVSVGFAGRESASKFVKELLQMK